MLTRELTSAGRVALELFLLILVGLAVVVLTPQGDQAGDDGAD